jgi:2-oxoisovalerate dehydrogenase E1 component
MIPIRFLFLNTRCFIPMERQVLKRQLILLRLKRRKFAEPGKDVSLITYGGSLPKCFAGGAGVLSKEGIEAEVVDLRVLRPLDAETFLNSVGKTHRAVIVDEGWRTGSFAGEISVRRLWKVRLTSWIIPFKRVCSEEVPMPYPKHLGRRGIASA